MSADQATNQEPEEVEIDFPEATTDCDVDDAQTSRVEGEDE